jgi:hypothetical protein
VPIELARCLGRRWRKEQPDFWQTLSPLGTTAASAAATLAETEPAGEATEANVRVLAEPSPIERMRERLLAEARHDAQQATVGSPCDDWTSSGIDGLMLDPDQERDPQEWR